MRMGPSWGPPRAGEGRRPRGCRADEAEECGGATKGLGTGRAMWKLERGGGKGWGLVAERTRVVESFRGHLGSRGKCGSQNTRETGVECEIWRWDNHCPLPGKPSQGG